MTRVRFIASTSASCFHAVSALLRGRSLVEPAAEQALREPVQAVAALLATAQTPPELFVRHVVPLSAGIENNRQLAETALRKASGPTRTESFAGELAGLLGDCERVYRELYPGLADELAKRSGPLRSQWEARGPGLLKAIGRKTNPDLIVEQADAVLVRPALGGGGASHLEYNSVRIEAVLANPLPELPEIVRLAWLLAPLQLDLPLHGERVHRDRLPKVAALAMLPATLEAAQYVELARDDPSLLVRAIEAWRLDDEPAVASEAVQQWWEIYQATRPAMSVGLQALDQLLA